MTELKTNILRITPAERFLMLLFLCLFLLFLDFGVSLDISYISIPFKIVSAIADSAFFIIMFMFLKGQWKLTGIMMVCAISVLLLANLLYYRNFEDIIQPSGYLNVEICDPTVIYGATSSLRPSDLLFLILPFLPLAYAMLNRPRVWKSTVRPTWKLSMFVIFLAALTISYAGVIRRKSLGEPETPLKEIVGRVFSNEIVTWRGVYEMHCFIGYIIRSAVAAVNIGMPLNCSDIDKIRKHLSDAALHRPQNRGICADSTGRKNLIMIIVESLPFKVLEIPEATDLLPNLMEMASDTFSIVSRCRVLAGYGRSSDAQFMFNTGLLPLRHEAFADNYADNDYPSLAKALNCNSMEIIGERKGLWNHSLTTRSYGFDTLIDAVAPDGQDQDSIIFHISEKMVPKLKPPFFLFITTISMHDPYDSQKVSDKTLYSDISSEDSRDREYCARLLHFDRSLGGFVSTLRREGVLDDSVIVILGDHEIRASKISSRFHDEWVPFIIINPPVEAVLMTESTQLDVFPTIMDMMGCRYRYLGVDYSGLGHSIFSEDVKGGRPYVPTDADYHISEMIIKGQPSN